MSQNSKYTAKLTQTQRQHMETLERIVSDAIEKQNLLSPALAEDEGERTFGQRIADKVANFGGSWTFIIAFFVLLSLWMALNAFIYHERGFDPYPFILLNLILSCLAAIQAPIIMMSQNRKEQRDRHRAEDDYLINLKAEIEIQTINDKLDLLIKEQLPALLDTHKHLCVQIEHMERRQNGDKTSTKKN